MNTGCVPVKDCIVFGDAKVVYWRDCCAEGMLPWWWLIVHFLDWRLQQHWAS